MQTAISVQNLRKSFSWRERGQKKSIEAVRGISLSVAPGEIFGFLGPNGAGKTTAMRMMTTLLPIGGGTVTIAGFDAERQPREVRRRIGYVGQLGGADLSATGRENLLLTGQLYAMSRREAEEECRRLARLLDLEDLLDRIAKTYSGGQKRRLEIALGLIHRPSVLFLDEPTTGLDPQNRASLWEHIRALRDDGMTVFLTTHYMEEADELADRLAIIDRGAIVAEGTSRELKRQISGDVVVVRPDRKGCGPDALLLRLQDQEFALEPRLDGESVLFYTRDGAKALPRLLEYLAAQQIGLDSISLSQPSLDDVFLKQTGRFLRDTGKEAAS